MIPYSHAIQHSDWLIAGAKPRPGELKENTEVGEESENKMFFDAVEVRQIKPSVFSSMVDNFMQWLINNC